MSRKISQRQARLMSKQLSDIAERDSRRQMEWVTEYPGGVHIRTLAVGDGTSDVLYTARRLGFSIICTVAKRPSGQSDELLFYAVKE